MYARTGKRIFDVLAAAAGLAVLSPVLLLIAVGVRLSSPGPAIFRQRRIGRHGRTFAFYKFRTMPMDTGDIPSDRLGDVRIGRFGRILRRTNLDELPQLVNVLRGDMSVVGPRPPIPSQTELVEMRRANGALDCRPGLTGLAQVNSFDGMTVAEKAAHDGRYAQNVTLGNDLRILLKTIGYFRRPPPKY